MHSLGWRRSRTSSRGMDVSENHKPRMVDGRGGEGSAGEAGSMEDDIRL